MESQESLFDGSKGKPYRATINFEETPNWATRKGIKPYASHWHDLLRPKKTPRDAVWGDILVTDLEKDIIDTQYFQRLREFDQLGLTHFLYPSATHNRFSHSLGTLYMTDIIIQQINRLKPWKYRHDYKVTYYEWVLARLAALLHDAGNIPFGHTLEDETGIIESYQEDEDRIEITLNEISKENDSEFRNKIGKHLENVMLRSEKEERKGELLAEDEERIKITSKEKSKILAEDVKKVLCGNPDSEIKYIEDMIKNTLCADLLDYLERDYQFCGLSSKYDERFMLYLYLADSEDIEDKDVSNNGRRLAVRTWHEGASEHRSDVMEDLCGLLDLRYKLASRVYYHRTKNIADSMLAKAAFEAGVQDWDQETMLQLKGDEDFLSKVENSDSDLAGELISRIRERDFFKLVKSINVTGDHNAILQKYKDCSEDAFEKGEAKTEKELKSELMPVLKDLREEPIFRAEMEEALAEDLGFKADNFALFYPNAEKAKKLAEMLVQWGDKVKTLEKVAEIDSNEKMQLSKRLKVVVNAFNRLDKVSFFMSKSQIENFGSNFGHNLRQAFLSELFGSVIIEMRKSDSKSVVQKKEGPFIFDFLTPIADEMLSKGIKVNMTNSELAENMENTLFASNRIPGERNNVPHFAKMGKDLI